MKKIVNNLSISKKYTLFLFGVTTFLLVASYAITSVLFSNGMQELYEQRLQRCKSTLDQYTNVHYVTKSSELEAVVTSPRFLAAVSTEDKQTIVNELPYYKNLLGATVFIVKDEAGNVINGYDKNSDDIELTNSAMSQIANILSDNNSLPQAHYILNNNELIELFETDIYTHDGLFLGRLVEGTVASRYLIHDLEQLTGFDIIVTYNHQVVASSSSSLASSFVENIPHLKNLEMSKVEKLDFSIGQTLYLTENDENLNISVTFLGLPDEQIAPIMSHVRLYLLGLAILGGLLTLIVVYWYTSRRIGRQINSLINATDKISQGDLDFKLEQQAKDEFGVLLKAIDKMRTNLLLNRNEILELHQERIQSERLASLGKSATGIIHDFKSPMAVIRGTIEILSMKFKENTKLIDKLEVITNQIDHMNQLSQDVIEFSRGKFKLTIESVYLINYFSQICQAQEASYKSAGISLKVQSEMNCIVQLDAARFRRVVDNILNNAREALKPGQQVVINWAPIDDALQIQIKDNGPGIPLEIQETIFEAFVTSGKESGTGLGLAIAKKIVEDHNATIIVESEMNVGTIFKINIPMTMVNQDENKNSRAVEENIS